VNLYTRKKKWKIFLATIALIIISASIYYTNLLVNKFAQQERNQIRVWADAVQRRASLMNYTESFFHDVRIQERQRVELLAKAYKRMLEGTGEEDLSFYLEMIQNNTSIPVIITDQDHVVRLKANLEPQHDTITVLKGKARQDFLTYEPITISLTAELKQYLYYRESLIFTDLKRVLDDLVSSFMTEVAINAASVPVIITDSTLQNVLQFGNLNAQRMADPAFVEQQIRIMTAQNRPIQVRFIDQGTSYIHYKSSDLLMNMRFFPLVQILIIALFLTIAYLLFSYARKAEQNQVWAGMAKETAHQIGTPLSSMMAWIELLKMEEQSQQQSQAVSEMEKDIQRLENITERFSKIGSPPKLEISNIIEVIHETLDYLKPRTSKKVIYQFETPSQEPLMIPLNAPLFMWVLENLCKNSIDAMSSHGTIRIQLKRENGNVIIDLSDTGKGMPKSQFKSVFNPGYTSKKRGWGLGLSLAKRIIRDYHKGKIFVKNSLPGEGTTFRIVLRMSR
jgi:signal transduction histidine kinase